MASKVAVGGRKAARANRRRQREKKEFKKRIPKWKLELQEIEEVSSRFDQVKSEDISKFADLPLSKRMQDGLRAVGYSAPTEIQREAIPLALRGKDVLGAAKTGSGKTLAFLIPVLELLWRERWSPLDGLGALVISPTRELAYQTFEVLRKVGGRHDFSAGLVIGGKEVQMERTKIQQTNIVVCTPGRLLQHMDETPSFDCSSLKILVLDEADRILDLGFERTMNAIVENLPRERQTLLFSATQTKSVRDLARLSLHDAEYVSVHEHSKSSTPHKLTQSFIVCELPEKLDVLFSFLRNHLSCKTLVFMSSCKQVKYVYEVFRRFRPGIPLMALYGRQKQMKRVGIYNDFCRKKAAVLFCTDIAARGLDFPAVHWVVQLDCPEDANTYIHRVGRTARYEKEGKALLFLLPSEKEGMLEALQTKKIPILEIRVNPKKMTSIQKKLGTFCVQDQEMKHWAQRSFICYLRSVHLQSNKKIFDVHKLPTAEYAHSLGLAQPPRIRFLRAEKRLRQSKTASARIEGEQSDEESCFEESQSDKEDAPLWSAKADFHVDSDSEEGDILQLKRVIQPSELEAEESTQDEPTVTTSSRSKKLPTKFTQAKKVLRKKIKANTHVRFNEEMEPANHEDVGGNEDSMESPHESIKPVPIDKLSREADKLLGGIDIKDAQRTIKSRDKVDRRQERERVRARHREKKQKLRKRRLEVAGERSAAAHLALESESEGEEVARRETDSGRPEDSDLEMEAPVAKRARVRRTRVGDGGQMDLLQDEELALHLLATD